MWVNGWVVKARRPFNGGMPDYVTGFYRPDSFPFEQRQAFAYDFFPAVSPAASDARSALLVWVHGGAWRFGDNHGLRDISRAQGAMRALFQRAGWAVASVNYRYSHQGLFPAPLHDVAEAVRFFRANAAQFGVDAGRIAIAGGSAGGHLAMLCAFAADSAASGSLDAELAEYYLGFGSSAYPDVSASVVCAGSFYGVSDVRTIFSDRPLAGCRLAHRDDDGAEWRLLGSVYPVPADTAADAPARVNWARAHPLDMVRTAGQQCPRVPLFLAHGIADSCVPYQQSVRVFNALKAHRIPTDLVLVPGAEHADPSCFSPGITAQFLGFLQQHMPTDSTDSPTESA